MHALNAHIVKEKQKPTVTDTIVISSNTTAVTEATPNSTDTKNQHPHPDAITIVPDFGHLSATNSTPKTIIQPEPESLPPKPSTPPTPTIATPVNTPSNPSSDPLIAFKEGNENANLHSPKPHRTQPRSQPSPQPRSQPRPRPSHSRPSQPRPSQGNPSYNIQGKLRQNAVSHIVHRR